MKRNIGKETFQWIIFHQEEEEKEKKKKADGDQLSSHCLPAPTKEIVGVIKKRQCSMAVYLLYFGLHLYSN